MVAVRDLAQALKKTMLDPLFKEMKHKQCALTGDCWNFKDDVTWLPIHTVAMVLESLMNPNESGSFHIAIFIRFSIKVEKLHRNLLVFSKLQKCGKVSRSVVAFFNMSDW